MRAVPEANKKQTANSAQPESGRRPEPELASPLGTFRPQVFAQVPTHVIGAVHERRRDARASLRLPMRLTAVAGQAEPVPVTLLTQNISSSGIFFLAPRRIEPGTAIELEVALVERRLGQGSVRMATAAHVVRLEGAETPGWHGVAASFDDFHFRRDEAVPPRFLNP